MDDSSCKSLCNHPFAANLAIRPWGDGGGRAPHDFAVRSEMAALWRGAHLEISAPPLRARPSRLLPIGRACSRTISRTACSRARAADFGFDEGVEFGELVLMSLGRSKSTAQLLCMLINTVTLLTFNFKSLGKAMRRRCVLLRPSTDS